MKITYDPESDAMNIQFQKGKYEISKEIAEGIIIDYTKDGKVLSIEILDASKRMPIASIKDVTVGLPIEA
ncbi:uncharacterized conserved small protein [Candidatus Methanoperedens nitroreducens]|uniref:Uncharacterized conserved small protein n=1 Tax=Candidatus Methanoperedens nitratireducens TaxID=1392998 RepID=A0A062UUU9_9EURY|nr:DUF2283 domain-containing protein [Candidatus Methanoperedens nitroreducens]KCZ70801.1 uncharacterized conserved small protein [Candidatus Methanoperedens nitroreducens]MDJ1420655.1 DUF2283 domain-containing protein [Candidatus Methanoperedens sp.]